MPSSSVANCCSSAKHRLRAGSTTTRFSRYSAVVPQGEIALVLAADGAPIPTERILGKVVDCDNFQDARKFLLNGVEKGRQLGILTAGTYRINSALFTVITSASAPE